MTKQKLFFSQMIIALSIFLNPMQAIADQARSADKDWNFRAGLGTLYSPAFLGSDEYQLKLLPDLRVAYRDRFFASIPEGVGYNLINEDGWRIGPVAKIDFGRDEDGESSFQVGGSDTTALQGLGDVDETYEVGGFAEYSWSQVAAKVEVRQGIDGHEGLVADFNLSLKSDVSGAFYQQGPPILVSVGPRATVVDDSYNETYFGITPLQSSRSGLPVYSAEAGLLSYGIGGRVIIPLNRNVSAVLFAGYDRLAQDAADSPLVQQRGSENQGSLGIFLSYSF